MTSQDTIRKILDAAATGNQSEAERALEEYRKFSEWDLEGMREYKENYFKPRGSYESADAGVVFDAGLGWDGNGV